MVVQHNLMAMNSNRMLGITSKTIAGSTEKLSSGYRINRAADDAAGLAISEKMRKQVRGLTQASANAEDGISCVQTAEGALAEVQDMLQRMNELCVQAANGTNSTTDRSYIQDELDQLVSEIDRIAETTKFNETFLLKGDSNAAKNSVYMTNYSVTYTRNAITNAIVESGIEPTTYCINYTGTNNVYVVSSKILTTGSNMSLSAEKIVTGADMTKYLEKDLTAVNMGKADLNTTSYQAFVTVELNSVVKIGDSGEVWGVNHPGNQYDLSTDGTSSIVRANRGLYVYNTSTGTITHITQGSDMTKYLTGDNTMDNQYRLVDILYGTPQDGSGGVTSQRVRDSVTAGADYIWDDSNLQIDESMQKLYNADGIQVSGMALNNYFDENGNYKGGLYTTPQARAIDEVFASTLSVGYINIHGIMGGATTIGNYITQSSQQIAGALSFSLQVGAQSERTNKITANIETLTAAGLGIDKLASFNIGIVDDSGENATDAVDVIGDALSIVSRQRSALGAVQNRLDHTIKNLDNVVENTTAAEAAIRDTDMAEEMVRYSNANILQQAGQAMLAQANQSNEGVLSLLQ